jgi:polyphosphate kinase
VADLSVATEVALLPHPKLRAPTWQPITPARIATAANAADGAADLLEVVRNGDLFLHYPYESFDSSAERLFQQAAADPDVLSIRATLYRTGATSSIPGHLIQAARAGKEVVVLVEIKARFDEAANIEWARRLEEAGAHVIYGMSGLKTHCKLVHVIREEKGVLKHYSHIGTGNYNPKTSRVYEDFGLFTNSEVVGKDLTKLFNVLSGYAIEKKYKRLLVAPLSLRNGLIERIEAEASAAREGKPSGIRIKANSMVDEATIDALYLASQAGVPIDILVRGICAVRAGQPGYSETIRVRSVLGRYLEHSRIYSFVNGGEPIVFIGSADLMHRNLDRRIEALVRLEQQDHLDEIEQLFSLAFSDEISAWSLESDDTWVRRSSDPDGNQLHDMQDVIMRERAEFKVRGAR